ncbi:hypothetical protein K9U39_03925 [Rhodoblastus acidophilus]|uniref:Uncharacterized protein n=1 Tax=Candidatus Rhodoblastus alkanivorans TaxID=2954117 RepID=A0ABS9Z540_9HYPH|nr:hypothetical protein [Candidatus Rhodoblastus alkanivorans]MCI4680937.1 hypothetical protein [Candidatus Rhodoblastus alkanivorans]MCI4682795.1 hypothetical protein [Candidatus Rhodoblastus alkanivorans]MDI4640103.1 hypothetical protein [Rhodoblastus acidophilus]
MLQTKGIKGREAGQPISGQALRIAAKDKIIEIQHNFVYEDDASLSPEMLRKNMKEAIFADALTADERDKLDKFSAYIEKMFASCLARKGYTKDAITFISDFDAAEAANFKSNKNSISEFVAKYQN